MKVRWSDHSPSPQSHWHQCQCWVCSESSSSVGSMSNRISCCNKSICFCPTFITEWSLSIRNPLLLAIEAVTVDDSLRFIGARLLAQLQSMDRKRTGQRTSWVLTNIRYLFPPTRIFRKYWREVFADISNQIDAINFNTLVPLHLLLFNSVEEWRRGRDQSCPTLTHPSCGHYRNILVAFGRIQLMI